MVSRSQLINAIEKNEVRTIKEIKESRKASERGDTRSFERHRDNAVGLQRQNIRLQKQLNIIEGKRSMFDFPKGIRQMEKGK